MQPNAPFQPWPRADALQPNAPFTVLLRTAVPELQMNFSTDGLWPHTSAGSARIFDMMCNYKCKCKYSLYLRALHHIFIIILIGHGQWTGFLYGQRHSKGVHMLAGAPVQSTPIVPALWRSFGPVHSACWRLGLTGLSPLVVLGRHSSHSESAFHLLLFNSLAVDGLAWCASHSLLAMVMAWGILFTLRVRGTPWWRTRVTA